MDFDLLPYCNKYNCAYAAVASPDNDPESISYVLRFPFIKVYALNEHRKDIPTQRKRFEENNRIQIFHNAHQESFFEMSRMIPMAYPTVFILKAYEPMLLHWFSDIAANRPKKSDVILAINQNTNDSAIFNAVSRFFGWTHEISMCDGAVLIKPVTPASSMGLEFDEDEHA